MSVEVNKSKAYELFFKESASGQDFVAELIRLIAENHQKAEDQPNSARDFAQRAKGVREVLSHIQSVMTPVKKGRADRE